MKEHQQRVVDEKIELEDKLSRLRSFLYSVIFNGLSREDQARLLVQEYIMTAYSDVLGERIRAFV